VLNARTASAQDQENGGGTGVEQENRRAQV